ncbi:MAG TPA: YciI family protein [Candidatus Limnocylindrales bacterium]|jgi:hypothetical protein
MTRYLISFPSGVMEVTEDELPAVADAAHAVIREARAAGVYVFTGGIDEDVEPVVVAGDGTVIDGSWPGAPELTGGFTVVEVASREEALEWAARLAVACRCAQEVRAFQLDPLV